MNTIVPTNVKYNSLILKQNLFMLKETFPFLQITTIVFLRPVFRLNSSDEYLNIIHEKIYQSPDYAHVNLGDYIQEEVRWMKVNTNVSKGIKLSYDLDDVYVDMVKAIPLGLITSEIVHNSFNYAFPNGEGLIEFSLKEESEGLINNHRR